jgi:hypothetical protein
MKEHGRKGGQSHTEGSGSLRTVVHLDRWPQSEVIGQAAGRDNTGLSASSRAVRLRHAQSGLQTSGEVFSALAQSGQTA